MISFLSPLFLIAATAAAIPLVMHLRRRHSTLVIDFPAVRLLESRPFEQQRRRRLRELLLLALRMAALALLAFAFARPFFQSATAAAPMPATLVALDTSLSLTAPGQFERARAAAQAAVERAPATHTVGLVTFHDTATLVVPPTTDRGGVLSTIAVTQPTAGGTRFRSALARAAEAITSGQGTIVVVTDLQQAGRDAADEGSVPDGIDVEVIEVAGPVENLSVTAARRDGDAVVAAVHNFSSQPARSQVQLLVDTKVVLSQSVEVGAHASRDVRLRAPLGNHGSAAVAIDDPRGYQADNTRYIALEARQAVPVVLVTAQPSPASRAGLYLERALEVADDGRAFDRRTIAGREFAALSAEQLARSGAVLLLGSSTLDRAARQRLSAFLVQGGQMLVALGSDIDLATLGEIVGGSIPLPSAVIEAAGRPTTLVVVDTRHPIFRPFIGPGAALGNVVIDRYLPLPPADGAHVLARFSGGGEAFVEYRVGQGRVLLFGSDLDNQWNRFPLNPAFVPWAVETARYLTKQRDPAQDYTLPALPSGVPSHPGAYRVGERLVTVNFDIRESNPAAMTREAFIAGISRSQANAPKQAVTAREEEEDRQRIWQVALMVMLVALCAESFLGRHAV